MGARMLRMALGMVAFSACSGEPEPAPTAAPAPAAPEAKLDPIRIGWQTTWATQGQLAVILMRTDILEKQGFDAEFKGFSYGGPLNEGALAGEVDVLFTADQPALSLMARAADWRAIGRLMYNRVGVFVPPDSPAKAPADLKGGSLAVPFGAAAHREAIEAIQAAGLKPGEDVQLVNLGIEELVSLVSAGSTAGRWGAASAGAAWDPAFADLETSGKARTIAESTVTSLVVMDTDYAAARPGADQRFMTALREAYGWYRAHPAEANRWFQEESKLPFDAAVLDRAASVEPNLKAEKPEDISVSLSAADVAGLQEAADFMVQGGLLKEPVQAASLVRAEATAGLPAPAPGKVKIKPAQ